LLTNEKKINLILLVEGITEKTLLPEFSKAAGLDFKANGIKIISSGGKNRLLRIYKKLISEVDTPVFMVMDADAEGLVESNVGNLRSTDNVYILSTGEFEDILPNKLIYRALNNHYKFMGSVTNAELCGNKSKAGLLTDLYRIKGFGDFKKAEFAGIIAENIKNELDLSEELKEIINLIGRAAGQHKLDYLPVVKG